MSKLGREGRGGCGWVEGGEPIMEGGAWGEDRRDKRRQGAKAMNGGDKEVESRFLQGLAALLTLSYYGTNLHYPNHTHDSKKSETCSLMSLMLLCCMTCLVCNHACRAMADPHLTSMLLVLVSCMSMRL